MALLDLADPDVLLEALADRHLLDDDGDRYVLHDLIRAHARARAERDEDTASQDAAVRRAIEWYLRFAAEADLAVDSHRPTTGPVYRELRVRPSPYGTGREAAGRALAALRGEHRNLCAAVQAAGDRGWHDLAWQLCEALWGVLLHAQALRATTLEFIGRAHLDAGDAAKAIGYFHRSRELEEANGRSRGVAINLHHLARAHLMRDAEDEALPCLARAREIFASIPDPYNEGRVLHTHLASCTYGRTAPPPPPKRSGPPWRSCGPSHAPTRSGRSANPWRNWPH